MTLNDFVVIPIQPVSHLLLGKATVYFGCVESMQRVYRSILTKYSCHDIR